MTSKTPSPIADIKFIFDASAAPPAKKNFFAFEIAEVQNDFNTARGSAFHTEQRFDTLSMDVRVDRKGLLFRIYNPAVMVGSGVGEIIVPMHKLPKDAFESYKTIIQNPSRMPNYEVQRAQLHAQMVRALLEKALEKGLDLGPSREMHYALRKTISLWFDAFVRPGAP